MEKETNIKTIVFTKGMVKDINSSSITENVLTHARNAMLMSHKGDLPFYTNEPSNFECITLPFKFNGSVPIKENKYLVFSSNEIEHEIGIADLNNCTYEKVNRNTCMNLKNDYIVTGIVREDSEGNVIVLFNDNYNNPRLVNLSKLPYKFTIFDPEPNNPNNCPQKIYTDELDCESLKLFPAISFPCIDVTKTNGGELPDGTYSVAIAYSISKNKFSDYYSLTIPICINNKQGENALSISIDNLDEKFSEFELVLIGTVNGVTTSKIIGYYSTFQNLITVSDWNNSSYETITNELIVVRKRNFEKAGIITSNSQYAMLAELTRKPEINTQYYTNQIQTKYVVHRYPESYYKNDGRNIGHYRDENYNYYLEYLWDDGEATKLGQIPGRKATDSELQQVTPSDDVYELDVLPDECPTGYIPKVWEVQNTASIPTLDPIFKECGVKVGEGYFGYHETSEKYPDNAEIFGENSCSNIRLHKYPDECKVPRYTIDPATQKVYINILGFKLENVPHPLDANGNPISRIVGYNVYRADRSGNNRTVIARGMFSNIRGYEGKNENVLYSNYPYNYLGADNFLSKTEVEKKVDNGYVGLDKVYNDKFAFYSPHSYFFEKYRMGTEFKFETEETAEVVGKFVKTYKHPAQKLPTNTAIIISMAVGMLQAYYVVFKGSECLVETPNIVNGTVVGVFPEKLKSMCNDLGLAVSDMPNPLTNFVGWLQWLTDIDNIIKLSAQAISFQAMAMDYANKFLKNILDASGYFDYVYQYDSHGFFNRQICTKAGYKRRKTIQQPLYVPSGKVSYSGYDINNIDKQTFVLTELNKPLANPSVADTTQNILGFNVNENGTTLASMFYGTSKIKNPNQYGSIDILNPVKTHNCVIPILETTSPDLFGGDCIIYRFAVNTKQPIFSQTLNNTGLPDGTAFDYRLYRNIGFPRFWADFSEFDMGEQLATSSIPVVGFITGLVSSAKVHNLDKGGVDSDNPSGNKIFVVKKKYMYTDINGVIEFIAEADYNIAFRDNKNEEDGSIYQPHYSSDSSNVHAIFRADRIKKPEGFTLDVSYKKLVAREIYNEQLLELTIKPIVEKNSIIYSLPAFSNQKINNWQYFLPSNYFTFDERDFGKITGIHALDQDKVIFLFSKSSPYISIGRDQLEATSGRKITIGDGGLFAQQPRELLHTDVYYGSSMDKHAFKSTQFGSYYISREQGKIFEYGKGLNEVSRQSVHQWCFKYLPLQLLKDFPSYINDDAPQTGVGYQIAFDNIYETVYICKRDFKLKDEHKGKVTLVDNKFYYNGSLISLNNPDYFIDSSFTLSYSPSMKLFVSFHDWHPDWVLQEPTHFSTVKGNKIYKHNVKCDSFCNFYGKDYPYELEQTLATGQNTHILNSVEWHMEAFVNKNDCQDRFHSYSETFDRIIIYNTEQNSNYLNLEYKGSKKPSDIVYKYPELQSDKSFTVVYDKTEQHFRFNMFNDITKYRDVNDYFSTPMWITHPNGYVTELNQDYIDVNKPVKERKQFRHNQNSVRFIKQKSDNNQFINKFNNFKINYSIK